MFHLKATMLQHVFVTFRSLFLKIKNVLMMFIYLLFYLVLLRYLRSLSCSVSRVQARRTSA